MKYLWVLALLFPLELQAINISLTWSPVSKNVKGDFIGGVKYNVYRSDSKPDGTQDITTRSKINPTALTVSNYLDTVPNEGIYYYDTTAISPNGGEGPKSNTFQMITADYKAAAPVGLTGTRKDPPALAARKRKP